MEISVETVATPVIKRTPLYDAHLAAGAKMVPFAGWEMPIQYPLGIIEEHRTVRSSVGIFDVSHMGEIEVRGPDALSNISNLTCNDPAVLVDGKAQYSAFLNERGGVVDDIIVYRHSAERFLICVNASNAAVDFEWCRSRARGEVSVIDRSSEYGQIAIQGPRAVELCVSLFPNENLSAVSYFSFKEITFEGSLILAARTGYTGEDGFEFFIPWDLTPKIWEMLLSRGKAFGISPAGLGARDSLRLEACLPLHGHELSPQTSALESGLGWIVKFNKPAFVGREALAAEKAAGVKRKLAGLVVEEAGIVREGTELFDRGGSASIGRVTSGTKTPTVGKAIALAFIDSEKAVPETQVSARVRDKMLTCRVVKTPFYKRKS